MWKQKKVYVTISILVWILLSACLSNYIDNYRAYTLGISIPKDIKIISNDTHGGFHGDGDSLDKMYFDDKNAIIIDKEIKASSKWHELPLTENLQLIMYGGKKDLRTYGYDLANEAGIPNIENGYWLFIDRHSDKNALNDDAELFDRHSYNFTLAIYDIDSKVLYYYEFDT